MLHWRDVIVIALSPMVSQIIGVSIVWSPACSGADRRKHRGLLHWPLWGELTGKFPAQRVSNAGNVSISWRHHTVSYCIVTGYMLHWWQQWSLIDRLYLQNWYGRAKNQPCFKIIILEWDVTVIALSPMMSQITGVSIVWSAACSSADQRKHRGEWVRDGIKRIKCTQWTRETQNVRQTEQER